jgi:hypothetical protein
MRLAPDAVQNVESDSLTEGYKSKFPLFHKLFHWGVEKFGSRESDRVIGPSGDRVIAIQRQSNVQLR